MNNKGNPYQKKGNNTLFLVLGILVVIFLGLIFIGSMRESSINQLISSAAPDSSAFASDSLLTPPMVEEEEAVVEEEVKPEVSAVKDTMASSTVSASVIPADSTVENPVTPEPAATKVVESHEGTIYQYKVKKGDTMYKIAAKFGNKPADVVTLNGMADMTVQVDKQIKVKIKGLHSVAGGEGLNSISEKFGVPAKSILIANGLNSDALPSGIQLIIPLK